MADSQESKTGFVTHSDRWKTIAALLSAVAAMIAAVGGAWKMLATPKAPDPAPLSVHDESSPGVPPTVQAIIRDWVDAARSRNLEFMERLLTETASFPFRFDKDRFENIDKLTANYRERFKKYNDKYGEKKAEFRIVEQPRTFRDREVDDRSSVWKNLRDDYGFAIDDFAAVVMIQFPADEPRQFLYAVRPRPSPKIAGIVPYKSQ